MGAGASSIPIATSLSKDTLAALRAKLRGVNMDDPEIAVAGSAEPELRVDPADGGVYSRDEFLEHYGGTDEWDAALTAGRGGGGGRGSGG